MVVSDIDSAVVGKWRGNIGRVTREIGSFGLSGPLKTGETAKKWIFWTKNYFYIRNFY